MREIAQSGSQRLGRTLPARAILIAALMISGTLLIALLPAGFVTPSPNASPLSVGGVATTPSPSGSASSGTSAATVPPTSAECSSLETAANDPAWAATIQSTKTIGAGAVAAGLPASDLHLPYLGAIPDQVVSGVLTPGDLLTAECDQTNSTTPLPSGVAYDGQSNTTGSIQNATLDSNSLDGILTVNSSSNFYPNSATPTLWGAQLNAVLANVTILGQRGYFFWTQNVVSYDTFNDTIQFVDDTWNFTGPPYDMYSSSLVGWSPDGGNYTGTWVAFSPYIYCPPPFTVNVYVNSSVNSAGDQVLWYNYSLLTRGHFYADGTYDYLVFNSQAPGSAQILAPAPFEASGTQTELVTEGYEFDAFIGADDGANNLILGANATEQLKYCSLPPTNDCTPTNFQYSSVPAAVNYGSQTGEETVGVSVNYEETTAYLSGGPLIANGLWGYTAQVGSAAGNIRVTNDISVTGSPIPAATQPYVFVFLQNAALTSQGFGWAPDVRDWYLSPGTWNYEIMLADYAEQTGSITVGAAPVTLTATLPYSSSSGVYTPLWAFNDAEVAGISSSGNGTISSQYVLFNNPTFSCMACDFASDGNLSSAFFSANDYAFQAFPGLFLNGTNVYVDVNAPPTFGVPASGYYYAPGYAYDLNLQFFETSHVTLSNAAGIGGWSAQQEISFYTTVPASQNPAPQADVYVWNSTDDLIMADTFVAVYPQSGFVSPDQLVLYGGTDNVVWGNTFRDPLNVTTMGNSYAGIGEAEGGDLIYNNNFSIDNPVVYLPYDYPNVADCLPQSLGGCANNATGNGWYYNLYSDTWNVTPQPASNVAETVNGFALSGNVLGAFYPTQGGNYYWNYGESPNNYSRPYVDRFLYTNWSLIYPLGCGSIQAPGTPCGTEPTVVASYEDGMNGGEDSTPLLLALSFREVGLPAGTTWSLTLNGITLSTSNSTITASSLDTGTYSYTIGSVPGYAISPRSGTIPLVGPISIPTAITFTLTSYGITFVAAGLPAGTTWSVTIDGLTIHSTSTTLVFQEPNGTYTYNANAVGAYYPQIGERAMFTIQGASQAFSIVYAYSYSLTFTETGLPTGLIWSVNVTSEGPGSWFGNALAGTPITFEVANGTYTYQISVPDGYSATNSSGATTVDGAGVAAPAVSVTAASSSSSTPFPWTWVIVGIVVAVVIVGLAIALTRPRPPRETAASRPPPAPPSPP
ncbi:MAG: thermopsin family protease [Thermoplasmata archaeon]